jgi:hypothetical protein
MIENFRDGWLREFFINDKHSKRVPSDIEARLFRKLQLIDDAVSDLNLRSPPSNHFEKLCRTVGWSAFHSGQPATAIGIRVGFRPRRGQGCLSR